MHVFACLFVVVVVVVVVLIANEFFFVMYTTFITTYSYTITLALGSDGC